MSSKKRVRISFLVARTEKFLFWWLSGVALLLACSYLFWLNKVGMQGYVLSKTTEKHFELSSNLEQINAEIARHQAGGYIDKMSKKNAMINRDWQRFVVIKDTFTAQK